MRRYIRQGQVHANVVVKPPAEDRFHETNVSTTAYITSADMVLAHLRILPQFVLSILGIGILERSRRVETQEVVPRNLHLIHVVASAL